MKSHDKHDPTPLRPLARTQRVSQPFRARRVSHLLQVHPVPHSRDEILLVAVHFLHRFAAAQGKETPELSEDAAVFLARQQWVIADLARRVWRAVAANRGSLITAADFADS